METQLVLTVDAVVVAMVARAVCGVLRVAVTERGATTRRRIAAGERVAVARIRARADRPLHDEPEGARRRGGPHLAVSRGASHSRPVSCKRPTTTTAPTRSA